MRLFEMVPDTRCLSPETLDWFCSAERRLQVQCKTAADVSDVSLSRAQPSPPDQSCSWRRTDTITSTSALCFNDSNLRDSCSM